MHQIIYVLLAAAAMYFLGATMIKTAGALSSASFKIGGLKIPVLPAALFAGLTALVIWALFDAFGIRLAALLALVAIEAVAFYSMERGEDSSDSASAWLIKAFTLGGLFIAALVMLAAPSAP